jgi:hypothetical protein
LNVYGGEFLLFLKGVIMTKRMILFPFIAILAFSSHLVAQVDLGVKNRDLTDQDVRNYNLPNKEGVIIIETQNATLKVNDVIIQCEGKLIRNSQDLQTSISSIDPSSILPISISVLRVPTTGVLIPKRLDLQVILHRAIGQLLSKRVLIPEGIYDNTKIEISYFEASFGPSFKDGALELTVQQKQKQRPWSTYYQVFLLNGRSLDLLFSLNRPTPDDKPIAIFHHNENTYLLTLKPFGDSLDLFSLNTGTSVYESSAFPDHFRADVCAISFLPDSAYIIFKGDGGVVIINALTGTRVAQLAAKASLPDLKELPPTSAIEFLRARFASNIPRGVKIKEYETCLNPCPAPSSSPSSLSTCSHLYIGEQSVREYCRTQGKQRKHYVGEDWPTEDGMPRPALYEDIWEQAPELAGWTRGDILRIYEIYRKNSKDELRVETWEYPYIGK